MEYIKYLVLIAIGMCLYHIRQYIRELETENKILQAALSAYITVENEHS